MVLGGVGLAALTSRVDRELGHDRSVPFTLTMSSNAATWLLSTVAGALITTLGVVFSLTVAIVLTLVTVGAIIAHLDHLARRLQVGRLLRDIAAEGKAVVRSTQTFTGRYRAAPDATMTPPDAATRVLCGASAWVSLVDAERLFAAVPAGTTVRLVRTGEEIS